MAVHAHPDDESTSTGGTLARYALEGVETIVVTCTNGELGDGPGGIKPGSRDHNASEVAANRLAELHAACAQLNVAHLEVLGYRDSGMSGWDSHRAPDAFCNLPPGVGAARVAQLINYYRPDVVISYNPDDYRQHPDHLHCALVTDLAVRMTRIPAKLYAKAHGTTYWRKLHEALAQVDIDLTLPDPAVSERIEQAITAAVDVGPVVHRKRAALHAHSSQLNSSLAGQLPPVLFEYAFSTETYILRHSSADVPSFETDLFTGLHRKTR